MITKTGKNKAYLVGIVLILVDIQYYLNGCKHFLGLSVNPKADHWILIIYNLVMVVSFVGFYWSEKVTAIMPKRKE